MIIDSGHTVLDERDVLIVDATAGLSGVARKLADAGVGVYVAYFSPDSAVIGTQDVEPPKAFSASETRRRQRCRMALMESADLVGTGEEALATGRWEDARSAFERGLSRRGVG